METGSSLRIGERGQASVEWVGLTLLVASLITAMVAATSHLHADPGLARVVATRLICAVRLQIPCRHDPQLATSYDYEIAGLLREHSPLISYERGMRALPVDFRDCRSPGCADSSGTGGVRSSARGSPVTAFTHVVDCRRPIRAPADADCSGSAAGKVFLQYWLYYPNSATMRGVPVIGRKGFHLDDFESYQVRIGPKGRVYARASSHNGYNGLPSVGDWASDSAGKLPGASALRRLSERLGLRERGGWTPVVGSRSLLLVAGGSHAGRAGGKSSRRGRPRWTPPGALRLVPIESLTRSRQSFMVTPPWRKRVYRDPDYAGTE